MNATCKLFLQEGVEPGFGGRTKCSACLGQTGAVDEQRRAIGAHHSTCLSSHSLYMTIIDML